MDRVDTDNVADAEVRHFTNRAAQWWNPEGPFRTLHDINEARLCYVRRHCCLATSSVLDVGCGGGIFSESMARAGAQVVAVDAGAENIQAARQHAEVQGLRIDYRHGTVESLLRNGLRPRTFDMVSCMELLEHVPDPAALLRTCAHMLRPDGLLLCATLNRHPKAYFAAIVLAEYGLRLLPRGSHRYSQFIRPAELGSWCRASGLHVFDVSGLCYLPWLRRAFLCTSLDVNYFLAARLCRVPE